MHWCAISRSASSLIFLASLLTNTSETGAQDTPIQCGNIPQIGQEVTCSKPTTVTVRDNRECRTHILGLTINDPACEAQKAAANSSRQAGIAEGDIAYQTCLANSSATKAINRSQLSSWLTCVRKGQPITEALIQELSGYQTCRRDHQEDWQAFCCTPLSSTSKGLVSECPTVANGPQ